MSNVELEAFERFFVLTKGEGFKVSVAVRRVSEEFGVSVRTVYDWKRRGEWDKRVFERSREVNDRLAGLLRDESDRVVRDNREVFVEILNGLVDACVKGNVVRIESVGELLKVMDLASRLQRELDLVDVPIISSEYSPEKHIDAINGVLRRLKEPSRQDEGDSVEGGLQEAEVFEGGQGALRSDGVG